MDNEQTVVHKTYAAQVKKLADNVYEFVASTEDVDRDGEVVQASGWDLKNYKKNPVVMFAHDYKSLPIGKAINIRIKDNKLVSQIEFTPPEVNEFGDAVKRLVEWGALSAVSVGFVPREWTDGDSEKEPKRRYTKQELLEQSIVPVPSNPNALHEAREANVITVKEFEGLTAEPKSAAYVQWEPWTGGDSTTVSNTGTVDVKNIIVVSKPEETDNTIRIPVPGEAGKHDGHKVRTIAISEEKGISALYCIPCKTNITYLFSKDKWTMETARAWVEDHKGGKGNMALITQAMIGDEIDYLQTLIDEDGLNGDNLNALECVLGEWKHFHPQKQQPEAKPSVEIEESKEQRPRVLKGDELRGLVQAAVNPHLNYALGIVE